MKLTELAYFVEDVPATVAFYQTLLGTPPTVSGEGMAIFVVGDTKILIHKIYEPEENDLPPKNHIAFSVPDVDATCDALTAQGLTLTTPPRDYPWGRSAYLRDPNGNLIELTPTE